MCCAQCGALWCGVVCCAGGAGGAAAAGARREDSFRFTQSVGEDGATACALRVCNTEIIATPRTVEMLSQFFEPTAVAETADEPIPQTPGYFEYSSEYYSLGVNSLLARTTTETLQKTSEAFVRTLSDAPTADGSKPKPLTVSLDFVRPSHWPSIQIATRCVSCFRARVHY